MVDEGITEGYDFRPDGCLFVWWEFLEVFGDCESVGWSQNGCQRGRGPAPYQAGIFAKTDGGSSVVSFCQCGTGSVFQCNDTYLTTTSDISVRMSFIVCQCRWTKG